MANSRQVGVLLSLLRKGDYVFSAETRREFHSLVRQSKVRSPLAGYVAESDAHPLAERVWWPSTEQSLDAHLVSVVSGGGPFAVRSAFVTVGKPTSYSFARAIRAAILSPCGLADMASAPALVLLDGDAVCRSEGLENFIAASGSRRIIAKKGAPHAKPRVEGAGAMVQCRAAYPMDFLEAVYECGLPEGTLGVPASVFAEAYQSAVSAVNESRLSAWVDQMHRFALGISAAEVARIAALRWPVVVSVRNGIARLETGETFCSRSIEDLEDGRYGGTRSLDPLVDDLRVTIDDEVIAEGGRVHRFPVELQKFQHFLEAPRR